MKSVLVLFALASSAYADAFPKDGPCDDVDACEKSCKVGKTAACAYGGVLAMQSAVDEAMKARGEALFVKACNKGDAESCWFAARHAPDETAAKKLYDKGCAKSHVRACFQLATITAAPGDAKAQKAATAIYKKTAKVLDTRCTKKKDALGCEWLANMWASGQGVGPDAKKADQYKNRACQIKTGQPCPPPGPPPPPPGVPQQNKRPETKAD